jgi:NitT/TauT family transport system substrate-binding protein
LDQSASKRPAAIGRRACLAAPLAASLAPSASPAAAERASLPVLRLGILQFGTAQWVADVIRRHRMDAAHGFTLQAARLANTDAGRVALLAGGADVVVSDWPFVAVQRASGNRLCFAPFSSATGGIMVRAGAPIRSLADLRGRSLGVAGGPLDKSWLLVQAAGRMGTPPIDLAASTRIAYGAPPLLDAKLMQGELDAVLTFWNFAARLRAASYREAIDVADCARALGLPPRLGLLGFVFHQEWAEAHRQVLDGFLDAAMAAQALMARSDAEWSALRPLMDAPDPALFAALRDGFVAGIGHPTAAEEQATAARVLAILLRTGGRRATGGIAALPSGVFWPEPDARI